MRDELTAGSAYRFRCTVCGKLTLGRLPRSGYHKEAGVEMYPRRHSGADRLQCAGNVLAAEWVIVARTVTRPRPPRARTQTTVGDDQALELTDASEGHRKLVVDGIAEGAMG